jgi:hypothetical protein
VLKYDEEMAATAPVEEVDGEEVDDDDEAVGLAEGLGTGRPTPKTVLKFGGESATETAAGPFGDDDNGGEGKGNVAGPEEDFEVEVEAEVDILDPIELPTDAELEIVVSGGRGTWMFSPVPEPEPEPVPVAVAETEPVDKDRVKRGIEKSFCGATMGGDI